MKNRVRVCRFMYLLLIACVVGSIVLFKGNEPFYALAVAFGGMFIVLPLTIASVVANDRALRRQAEMKRPLVTPIASDEEPLPVGNWRETPDELQNMPKWGHQERLMHVVDGVNAFPS
jgi:hypothetical protein